MSLTKRHEARTIAAMPKWELVDGGLPRSGGNALVEQVTDSTGQLPGCFARKTLKADLKEVRDLRFRKEVEIAATFQHPHIVPVVDSHLPTTTATNDRPYLVMPWFERGRVRLEDTRCRVSDVMQEMRLVLEAVRFLHNARRIAHRDIKPANILRGEAGLLLTDFGLCLELEGDRLTESKETAGSLGYVAPELVGHRKDDVDHRPADIFSLGRTLWAMIAGEEAPHGAITLQHPDYNLIPRCGRDAEAAQDLIQRMTSIDPHDRPTIEDVIEELDALSLEAERAPVIHGAALARRINRFVDTDAQTHAMKLSAHAYQDRVAQIKRALETIRAAVDADESLKAFKSGMRPDVGTVTVSHVADGFRPAGGGGSELHRGILAEALQLPDVPSGTGFSVEFRAASPCRQSKPSSVRVDLNAVDVFNSTWVATTEPNEARLTFAARWLFPPRRR